MPLVSVIIPYYKKIDYIYSSINSVLNQSFKDFEIILVYDDPKLDDLTTIKKKFGKNSKLKIITNTSNSGAGTSRNIGIQKSNGKILAFLDADDIWHEHKLQKQINFMTKNNYDFVFCDYEKIISQNKKISIKSKKKLSYMDLLKSCDIGLSTVLINKKIIRGELFPNLKTQEDYVAWLKITKENTIANNLGETLTIWNNTNNSLSSNFFQKIFDGFNVYYKYQKFNFLKSLFFLLRLSINSLRRKF